MMSAAMMAEVNGVALCGNAWSIAWLAVAAAMPVAPELFAWVLLHTLA
jgi:hypothetical protein